MIEACEILCSQHPTNNTRLMTMLARYPRFVHAEHLRSRSFSFSVSSSRAIPVAKNIEEVRSDELRAAPIFWGAEQKGMSAGDEINDIDKKSAQREWSNSALFAVIRATNLTALGVHKSIVNRILEPFLHVNVLVTGTTDGWMNFFG